MPDIPVTEWDETLPTDAELRSLGDDRIREMKTQIREILEVDHEIESTGSDTDWGQHNKVTLYTPTAGIYWNVAGVGVLYPYRNPIDGKVSLNYDNGDTVNCYIIKDLQVIGGIRYEIRPWYGTLATIPSGWYLCDGNNGTPNLLTKFIMGIHTSSSEPGTTGGSNTISLSTTYMPAHHHSAGTTGSTHTHYLNNSGSTPGTIQFDLIAYATTTATSGYTTGGTHSHTTQSDGSGTAFDNRPAFYTVAFIMRY